MNSSMPSHSGGGAYAGALMINRTPSDNSKMPDRRRAPRWLPREPVAATELPNAVACRRSSASTDTDKIEGIGRTLIEGLTSGSVADARQRRHPGMPDPSLVCWSTNHAVSLRAGGRGTLVRARR